MASLASHLLAAVAFLGLIALLLIARQPGRVGTSLLVACAFSVLWAGMALVTPQALPFTGLSETLRILSWAFFLSVLIQARKPPAPMNIRATATGIEDENKNSLNSAPVALNNTAKSQLESGYFRYILLLAATQIFLTAWLISSNSPPSFLHLLLPFIWIAAAIIGLVCVESVYRGTAPENRRALKPLCIGLSGMFLLDFFVFTDTLLFRRINVDIWQARGFFYAFLVPVVAMTVVRNPDWAVRIHVSRAAVTSSIAMMGTGGYLLATAAAAYLITLSGVEWANVAQIAFVLISLVVLVLVLVSSRLRAKLRVNVSKHLFNFKYDYRTEWLNFTRVLSTGIEDAPSAIVQGLTQIMHSDGGELWAKNNDSDWDLLATKGVAQDYAGPSSQWDSLESFIRRTGWIVQLDEYRLSPELYDGLELPDSVLSSNFAWLIIPLPDSDKILGFVIVNRSPIIQTITWEDRDLLKTAGQQAAGLLIQRRSQEALTQARQFEAFSKLSAYVIHDLKNILGQQSLIVSNATKHKHKPAFVDDVILTVENSVTRMQALLEKLQEQQSEEDQTSVDLTDALNTALALRRHAKPTPTISAAVSSVWVIADADKLARVVGHLIHNAQDATSDDGNIEITLSTSGSLVTLVITDNGAGMTADFIKDGLFKPFVSSKGLTGMGIGVYESREYIRKLGGKIAVSSKLGKGTMFTVTLPTIIEKES